MAAMHEEKGAVPWQVSFAAGTASGAAAASFSLQPAPQTRQPAPQARKLKAVQRQPVPFALQPKRELVL